MASGWIKIDSELINSHEAYKLTDREFVEAFYQAADGNGGPLAAFVKPCSGRLPQSQWSAIRSEVFKRDNYTCTYCGERGKRLECDHIFPLSRGGSDALDNLTTACRPCNRSKRDKTVDEWVAA